MSLRSGRRINSNQWTVLHVTDKVVQQVHNLANKDDVQDMKDVQILFEWETGVHIQDRHAYEILMADGEVNDTEMQPLGNVGHDVTNKTVKMIPAYWLQVMKNGPNKVSNVI